MQQGSSAEQRPAHAAYSDGDWCVQVYKAMRRHVQECAVKILRNVNEDELTNFQRVCVLSNV